MTEHKSAWAEIHIDDIKYNLDVVVSKLPPETLLCGVLKADAYGHGMIGVKKCLSESRLVNMAAVGKMSEMKHLFTRSEKDGMDILLLGVSDIDEVEHGLMEGSLIAENAIISVYNMRQFKELNDAGKRLGIKIKVHIRVDGWNSGMGIGYWDFLKYEDELFSSQYISVCGLYSHLYSSYSDDLKKTEWELKRFDTFLNRIRPEHRSRIIVHILNSALVFNFPEYAYDMVRVGTAMYGLPCRDRNTLKPVMRLCAEIFDVREVDMSAPLSYIAGSKDGGRRKIARIMLGYWDSPLLLTRDDIRVKIKGRLFLLADDVCMDNLCIDITGADDIAPGDEAVLLGEDGVTVNEILGRNGIAYVHSEWLSMTAGRLEKVYL